MTKGHLIFSDNIKNDFVGYCKENHKDHIVFICDVNTEKYCLPYFGSAFPVIVIPDGELSKNIDTYCLIIKKLIENKTNKSSLIVNLGGGVVTDVGGFAASTYMRGIDFINVPTTLLGMVDASIGGKTGVDFQLNKNYIGTFSMPGKIFIYSGFLKTLAKEEIQSGSAEILKAAIISNQLLFQKIQSGEPMESLIQMAAETKQKIVETDPYDKDERQLLNFGHTIGHAFESYRLDIASPILHGFAVAIGMMAESRIAYHLGLINEDELNLIIGCITLHTGQTQLTQKEFEAIIAFMFLDKKNNKSEIVFSLPNAIGSGKIRVGLDLEFIKNSLFNA